MDAPWAGARTPALGRQVRTLGAGAFHYLALCVWRGGTCQPAELDHDHVGGRLPTRGCLPRLAVQWTRPSNNLRSRVRLDSHRDWVRLPTLTPDTPPPTLGLTLCKGEPQADARRREWVSARTRRAVSSVGLLHEAIQACAGELLAVPGLPLIAAQTIGRSTADRPGRRHRGRARGLPTPRGFEDRRVRRTRMSTGVRPRSNLSTKIPQASATVHDRPRMWLSSWLSEWTYGCLSQGSGFDLREHQSNPI